MWEDLACFLNFKKKRKDSSEKKTVNYLIEKTSGGKTTSQLNIYVIGDFHWPGDYDQRLGSRNFIKICLEQSGKIGLSIMEMFIGLPPDSGLGAQKHFVNWKNKVCHCQL